MPAVRGHDDCFSRARKHLLKAIHILGWATGALFFFYAWVLRVTPSVMIDEMMRDLAISGALLGNLSAFYFYGYAGLQLPVGIMIDRFGARRLMTIAGLACSAGCVVFAMSQSFWGVSAGRFLIGAAAAFSFVGAMSVAGLWLPTRLFALFTGLAMMMGMAGGVAGQAPLRLLVDAAGWRQASLYLASGGIVISIAAFAFVRDRSLAERKSGRVIEGLGRVMRNPQTWLISIAGLGTTAPLLGFAGLWGVPFFSAAHGLDRTTAASVTSMMFVGWGIGAPLAGFISDRIGRRRLPLVVGLSLCTLSLAALVHLPVLTVPAMMALAFVCGLGGASQIAGFAATREHNPVAYSGTALGLVNGMTTGAGALYQPLIGWALDLAWNGRLVDGARSYDAAAYRMGLSVLIAGSSIGLICALLMRETYCRQQPEAGQAPAVSPK